MILCTFFRKVHGQFKKPSNISLLLICHGSYPFQNLFHSSGLSPFRASLSRTRYPSFALRAFALLALSTLFLFLRDCSELRSLALAAPHSHSGLSPFLLMRGKSLNTWAKAYASIAFAQVLATFKNKKPSHVR